MKSKQQIRSEFRESVFERDGFRCAMCGAKPPQELPIEEFLDAHHICDRNLIPNGGYVKENGISLCGDCHVKAECFHSTGTAHPGYSPCELYFVIDTDYNTAVKAAISLDDNTTPKDFWDKVNLAIVVAKRLRSEFDSEFNQTIWQLACEEVGVTDPSVIKYGLGRVGAI